MVDEADQGWQEEASHPETSAERLIELSTNPRLRIVVASNPAAPMDLLAHLAQDPDSQVRQAVAGNPNAPWQTLEQLAWEFPRAFLHNPASSFQLLGHPEQVSISGLFWDGLLRESTFPSLWWSWLNRHPALRERPAARLHVQIAGEAPHFYSFPQEDEETLLTLVELLTTAVLQEADLPALRFADQSATSCERIIREHLQRLAQSSDVQLKQIVGGNPLTPGEVLFTLAQDHDLEVQKVVAGNHHTPEEALRALAQDHISEEVLQVFARDHVSDIQRVTGKDSHRSGEILRMLARDHVRRVREAVAGNPQTPGEILRALAQDYDSEVQKAAIGNPQTPGEVLFLLAQDRRQEVRTAVAGNPRTPGEALLLLSEDQTLEVRRSVAGNPQAPAEVLQALAQDRLPEVRKVVAENPQAPVEALLTLAQDHVAWVREAVAGSSQMPAETLLTLAQDHGEWVREAAAGNLQTPEEVLQALAQDHTSAVHRAASLTLRRLTNIEKLMREEQEKKEIKIVKRFFQKALDSLQAFIPIDEQLEKVAHLDVPKYIGQTIITFFAADWDATMCQTAFSGASGSARRKYILAAFIPPIALQKLAASPSWEVRYLVALHPRTPWEARRLLSMDGNRYVRVLARANREQAQAPAPGA